MSVFKSENKLTKCVKVWQFSSVRLDHQLKNVRRLFLNNSVYFMDLQAEWLLQRDEYLVLGAAARCPDLWV